MCYSATHLEKLDPTREQQWQKVARLTPEDMACVTNLEVLGVPGALRCRGSAGAALSASWWLACSQNVPVRCRGSSRRTGRAHCNQCPSICINSNLLLLLPLCPALPAVRKRNKGGGITFGRKRRRAVRKDREGDEDDAQFALTRFVPMLQEVLEDAGERRWWWHAGGRALCGRPCAGFPAVCPAGYVLVLQAACWMPAD